ncbi:MAG: hypothetical protein N2652_12310 [Kiritimatiellae bacterium]|nr:hypothetical protein [Kiritimatiellia bacterium]
MKFVTIGLLAGLGIAGWSAQADAPPVPQPVLSPPEVSSAPAAAEPPVAEGEVRAVPAEPLSAQPSREEAVLARLRVVLPRHKDYRHALGLELQWSLWWTRSFGLAVGVGVERWSAEEREYFEDIEAVLRPHLGGSALALPVGASLIYRAERAGQRLRLNGEVGLRFVYVSSEVTMTYEFVDHYGRPTRVQDTVDLDPRLVGIARLELTGPLEERWEWFLGGGYQLDFAGGENWLYEEVANDLSGIEIAAGLRRRL